MTFERKIVIGLEDIKAISFECNDCPFRITMSPDDVGEIPSKCSAGHSWVLGQNIPTIAPPLKTFTGSLALLRTILGQKALGFKILFEFDEPRGTQ
jgi:hypothetical protein